MKHYDVQKLEDGIVSYDCCYCGHSFLEEEAAKRHYRQAHRPAAAGIATFFMSITQEQFSYLWVNFVSQRIPKRQKSSVHFLYVFLRDRFAFEAARRGM